MSALSVRSGSRDCAASNNPNLKGAVSFAAWGPSGGSRNPVPSLMFQATADFLAAGMSDGFYATTPTRRRRCCSRGLGLQPSRGQ